MKLKYVFYAEVLIGISSAIMAMVAPVFFIEQLGVTDMTPVAYVFIQWYGVLLFAFTLIMALTLYRRSFEVLKIVFPDWVCRSLPGVTPRTTLVPYSIICSAWKVPSAPVKPCTIIFESLLTKTLISLFKI